MLSTDEVSSTDEVLLDPAGETHVTRDGSGKASWRRGTRHRVTVGWDHEAFQAEGTI